MEIVVPGLLETRLAGEVAEPIAAHPIAELPLVHLADVAEEVGGERAVRIESPRDDLERDAGQVELVGLERHHAFPVDVAPEHDALVWRALARRAHRLVDRGLGIAEVVRQVLQRLATVAGVLRHEDHVEGGSVVDQDIAVAVVDHAARAGQADEANPVVLRERAHLGAALELQVPEPDPHQAEGDIGDGHGNHDADL